MLLLASAFVAFGLPFERANCLQLLHLFLLATFLCFRLRMWLLVLDSARGVPRTLPSSVSLLHTLQLKRRLRYFAHTVVL